MFVFLRAPCTRHGDEQGKYSSVSLRQDKEMCNYDVFQRAHTANKRLHHCDSLLDHPSFLRRDITAVRLQKNWPSTRSVTQHVLCAGMSINTEHCETLNGEGAVQEGDHCPEAEVVKNTTTVLSAVLLTEEMRQLLELEPDIPLLLSRVYHKRARRAFLPTCSEGFRGRSKNDRANRSTQQHESECSNSSSVICATKMHKKLWHRYNQPSSPFQTED